MLAHTYMADVGEPRQPKRTAPRCRSLQWFPTRGTKLQSGYRRTCASILSPLCLWRTLWKLRLSTGLSSGAKEIIWPLWQCLDGAQTIIRRLLQRQDTKVRWKYPTSCICSAEPPAWPCCYTAWLRYWTQTVPPDRTLLMQDNFYSQRLI